MVERSLGAGGMGTVVAARHIQLRSSVAIKILSPQALRLPGAVDRFLREAQAAASLRSDHVGRVTDVGTLESGAPYLVMELLVGKDLQAILKERGRLPLEEALDFLLQTCEAIGEAHDKGIIHRDLKPANLFVMTRLNGQPLLKVLDFGLAKVLDDSRAASDAALTATGVAAGSPFYMAPEQIRGLKLADARSDVWSLGVIGYELLTGRRPFRAHDAMGVLAVILTEEPIRLRHVIPELPESIEQVILRCLQKRPSDRPQSVHELTHLLDACRSLEPLTASQAIQDQVTLDVATVPRAAVKTVLPAHGTGTAGTIQLRAVEPIPKASAVAEATSQTTLTVGASEVGTRPEVRPRGRWVRVGVVVLSGIVVVLTAIAARTRFGAGGAGARGGSFDAGTSQLSTSSASPTAATSTQGTSASAVIGAPTPPPSLTGSARVAAKLQDPPTVPSAEVSTALPKVGAARGTASASSNIGAPASAAPSQLEAPGVTPTMTSVAVGPSAPVPTTPAPNPSLKPEASDPGEEWK